MLEPENMEPDARSERYFARLMQNRAAEPVEYSSVKMGTIIQCCGSGMFIPESGSDYFLSRIPDPNFFHPRSRIRIKEFKYFNPKQSSRKYDLGCSSGISDPDPYFLPIPDPRSGVKKAPDNGSRIRNTAII